VPSGTSSAAWSWLRFESDQYVNLRPVRLPGSPRRCPGCVRTQWTYWWSGDGAYIGAASCKGTPVSSPRKASIRVRYRAGQVCSTGPPNSRAGRPDPQGNVLASLMISGSARWIGREGSASHHRLLPHGCRVDVSGDDRTGSMSSSPTTCSGHPDRARREPWPVASGWPRAPASAEVTAPSGPFEPVHGGARHREPRPKRGGSIAAICECAIALRHPGRTCPRRPGDRQAVAKGDLVERRGAWAARSCPIQRHRGADHR
jgi:hypothetical protein